MFIVHINLKMFSFKLKKNKVEKLRQALNNSKNIDNEDKEPDVKQVLIIILMINNNINKIKIKNY